MLLITFKSYPQRTAWNTIVPGRWDHCLSTCRNISKQRYSLYLTKRLMNICVLIQGQKALWDNTWRTNPTNGASSFGFNVALNPDISTTFIYKWIKKGAQNSVLGNLWQFHFVKSWKILIAMYSLTTLLLIQSFWSSYQKWELCN